MIEHYEQTKREEDISFKEIELIQLRLSAEATRVFQFLDRDLAIHVQQKLIEYMSENSKSPNSADSATTAATAAANTASSNGPEDTNGF